MNADPLAIIGQSFGEYEVLAFRDRGNFGLIYEARYRPTGTPVALKILRPSAGWEQQREFDNEGNLLLKMTGAGGVVDILDTDHVTVNVTAAGGAAQFPVRLRYHVLELADGCLTELLTNLPALDWPSRLGLFRNVVLGIHQMHSRKLVHRDVKGSNCLLFMDGRSVVAKINDLGRSRDLDQPPGALPLDYVFGRGDPDFAPPELLWGLGDDLPATHRAADLYGLRSVFFELAVGQGITALALFPQAVTIVPHQSLPLNRRRATYHARLAEIRDWYQPAFQIFDGAVPAAIRQQAGRLVRQLCDPDPERRLPQVALGRRRSTGKELGWLLNRVDILRLTLNNDLKQVERLRLRKGV